MVKSITTKLDADSSELAIRIGEATESVTASKPSVKKAEDATPIIGIGALAWKLEAVGQFFSASRLPVARGLS